MLETYCIDTSVFLDNPKVIQLLGESDIIIPFCVLTELDSKRRMSGRLGKNARDVIRYLDEISKNGNLLDGVDTEDGTFVVVISSDKNGEINDLKIVDVALSYSKKNNIDVLVLSNDIGLRVHASGVGLRSDSFAKAENSEIYSGFTTLSVSEDIIDTFFENKKLDLKNFTTGGNVFYPNQMIILKNNSQSAVGRVIGDQLLPVIKQKVWGSYPVNVEQNCAIELLMDNSVELVSLSGLAGTGKTYLSIAAAMEQVIERKSYKKIIVLRPVIPVGNDIGFLPGSLEEKIEPWIQPIKDNLYVLMNNKKQVDFLFEDGTIEIQALSHIRGRSISNSFIIVDESQNCSSDQLKTILTRSSKGSKVVLTGDIEQIDEQRMDMFSNGLSCVIEKFKELPLAGHVTLTKSQRSNLAAAAAKIL